MIAVTAGGLPGEVAWEQGVDGEIWSMFAGNGRLYIVTRDGRIYCFGDGVSAEARHYAYESSGMIPGSEAVDLAESIIGMAGVKDGYGLIHGVDDSALIKALVDNSSMHFVVAGTDPEKINSLRHSLDNAGIYGSRVSVINSGQEGTVFIPYIYSLMVFSGGGYTDDQIMRAFNSLRPYGGAAFFAGTGDDFRESFNILSHENGEMITEDDYTLVLRSGSLPGSSQWTHQYGSASNRTYSDDNLVKPPLGTLWFGGSSNLNALPRHHNGPIPQVAGGRLFILGVETISARCVYTGRELWVKEIPGIGHPFTDLEFEERFRAGNEVYMPNHPGANFIGSPYVSLDDAVYVIHGDRLMSLNAATGETEIEFRLPSVPYAEINEFGHLMVSGDYLVATIDPQMFDDDQPGKANNWNATSSNFLIVMDRHSGELMWTRRAETGFRHNAITSGNDRLFIVDGLSEGVVEILQRRGMDQDLSSQIMALDLKTGQQIWSVNDDVFGTWLGYYEDKDILLQGGRRGQRGAPEDEPRDRLIAHNGSTGEIIWESTRQYSGPLGLHPDMIISGRPGEPALNPYTGDYILKGHPLTGEEYHWNWHKYYGCGTMNSSKYLIMFRSGTAGYTDLLNFGGTGNLGGFRAGCTNSMVAADGVLNAPDYTRTCTCSYPLQTSVGMVHMPLAGIEMWTLNRLGTGSGPLRSLGINFAGQGNRKEDGVLWLEYPKVYAAGPDVSLKIESNSHEWFRNHATWIENGNEKYDWVASYGVKGITSMSVDLVPDGSHGEKYYNVTLYFAEPEDLAVGERVFDVYMQGEKVIENFDIVNEAGGFRRVLRKEFNGVKVDGTLRIDFSNGTMAPVISGVEIVMDKDNLSVFSQ